MATVSIDALIKRAQQATLNAYAPYSHYRVGAALLGRDGQVYAGCNVENASYPAGICAERGALMTAICAGTREFDTIVIATLNGGSPCGICRQMLFEFAPDLRVICVNADGALVIDQTLRQLLLAGFSPADLPQ